ncbi:ATP-binding protein [Oceanidesulfovibrio marinus]|uniref:histidine kinase n=1 Tax=Oceanidesulfovibrio marinus TaxID=370038 RepID=A0A6P1ZEI1_9BACT|nr:ATP-binding protein [Oceanidesulfovibrio marinus]TVM30827.1 hypothetical protein DQK91_19820 [Oceanidesulfovibrio marinus]
MLKRRLRFKFNCAMIAVCLGVSLLFGALFYYLDSLYYQTALDGVEQVLTTVSMQKRVEIAFDLYSGQDVALRASLEEMAALKHVLGVRAYDKDGNLKMEVLGPAGEAQLRAGGSQRISQGEAFLLRETSLTANDLHELATGSALQRTEFLGASAGRFLYTIRSMDATQGHIEIFYDLSDILANSRTGLILLGLTLVAMVLSMALLLNVLLSGLVIRPVEMLRNAMNRVREGLIGLQVTSLPNDEIGDMAAAFNGMSVELEAKRDSLMASEAKYRSLFENAVEGLFRTTMDGRILGANPALARILGYESQQELMHEVRSLESIFFIDAASRLELRRRLKEHGYVQDFEQQLRRRNGEVIWVAETVRLVPGLDGEALFMEGSLVDVTERRRAGVLEREKIQAEAQNRAKSEFLAAMSHEIRTPMNAILGMTDLAMASGLSPKQWEFMQTVKDSAFHLLTVINDILDLSKIEAGRLELEPVDFDLEHLMGSIAKSMAYQARKKGLELYRSMDANAPRYLHGDPARLRQVLLNLVGNAIKFTESGRVVMRVRFLVPEEIAAPNSTGSTDSADTVAPPETADSVDTVGNEPPLCFAFSVQDTGIGVPAQKQQEIFNSFTQAQGSVTSRKYGGTGLGLAISRKLVHMMGGEITLESEEGDGSIFTFTACFGKGDPEAVQKEETLLAEWSERRGALNILLVEDNPLNVRVAELHLKRMGHNIIVANNGEHALEIMSTMPEKAFDVVLMDLEMPVMDGFEATRTIRSATMNNPALDAGPNPNVPIIAMTAHALIDVKERCLEIGMNDFVAKPVNFADLSAAIQRAVLPDLRAGAEALPEGGAVTASALTRETAPPRPPAAEPPAEHCVDDDESAPPVLDTKGAIRTLGITPELFQPIFENSVREVRMLFDRLGTEYEAGDIAAVTLSAHTAKSTAATMGALECRDAARQVELAARDNSDALPTHIEAMAAALARLEQRIAADESSADE